MRNMLKNADKKNIVVKSKNGVLSNIKKMLENRQIHEQFREMIPETIFSLSNQLCHSNNKAIGLNIFINLHLHKKRERYQKLQK